MIQYTYNINTTYRNSITFSLCNELNSFDGIFSTLTNISNSVKTVRSMIINMQSYVDPIVELLNIAGQIPKPRNKMKKEIKNKINHVFDNIISTISTPLNMIENALSYMMMSLKDFTSLLNEILNNAYEKFKEKVEDVLGVNNDDDSVIASIKKYSTQIINTLTTVFKTVYSIINTNYARVIDLLNGLITNISVAIAKAINSSVETDDKLSDEEIRVSVNVILATPVLQPIISSLESQIIGKLYDCTKPLRRIGDKIGEILNWNFSML